MSTNQEEFDLDKFISSFDFTDEEKTTAKSLFDKDTRKNELKGRGLRQDEFDRKFNAMKADLKKEQEDLEAEVETKQTEIADERKKLGTYKTQLEESAAKEKIRALVADVKIKKASELYGIDIDAIEVPEAAELAKELKAKEAKTDDKEKPAGVSKDDVLQMLDYGLNVQAELDEIEETYKELNPGKKFPRKEFLEQARKNAAHRDRNKRKFMPQTAEEMFEFSTVKAKKEREEIEKAADDKYRTKWEEEKTQFLSKNNIRSGEDDAPRSTFWKSKQEKPTTRSRDDRVREVISKRNAA